MHSNRHSLSPPTVLRRRAAASKTPQSRTSMEGKLTRAEPRAVTMPSMLRVADGACARVRLTRLTHGRSLGNERRVSGVPVSRQGCWISSRKLVADPDSDFFVVVSDHNLRYAGICGFGAMLHGNVEPVPQARPQQPSSTAVGQWGQTNGRVSEAGGTTRFFCGTRVLVRAIPCRALSVPAAL